MAFPIRAGYLRLSGTNTLLFGGLRLRQIRGTMREQYFTYCERRETKKLSNIKPSLCRLADFLLQLRCSSFTYHKRYASAKKTAAGPPQAETGYSSRLVSLKNQLSQIVNCLCQRALGLQLRHSSFTYHNRYASAKKTADRLLFIPCFAPCLPMHKSASVNCLAGRQN